MLDTVLEPRVTPDLMAPLRPIGVDEEVSVWCGCATRGSLPEALEFCRQIPTSGKRMMVLWASGEFDHRELTRHARAIATATDLVIVVGENAAAVKDAVSFKHVQAEEEPVRAVVASLQLLGKGETLILLAPDEPSLSQMRAAAHVGSQWRGAWDEADGGDFHTSPRPADLLWHRI